MIEVIVDGPWPAGAKPREVDTVLVVPCFEEASRWNSEYWDSISAIEGLKLVFVDDGSTDSTRAAISEFARRSGGVVLALDRNRGKAEAVREGLLWSLMRAPRFTGFLDADAAFPATEVTRLVSICREWPVSRGQASRSLWSSRVKLAGRDIERQAQRHYVARILLTLMALRLKFDVYDTQSGFKIFPATADLGECLREPFRTRWFVDLEILLRWRAVTREDMVIWEEPVTGWRDVPGSKVSGWQLLTVLRDVATLTVRKP